MPNPQDIYTEYPFNIYKIIPKKVLADSGRSAKFLKFSIFLKKFFSEISVVRLFFWKKHFLVKISNTQYVSKNHEKNFGDQHNIKQLSQNFFGVYTHQARKKLIFSIFHFFLFLSFSKFLTVFPRIIFFIYFWIFKKKFYFFFSIFFGGKKFFFQFFSFEIF